MRLPLKAAVAASKVLARLHCWSAAASALAGIPLSQLDGTSTGRLQYALMMAPRTDAHRLLDRVLQRNVDTTPELRIELAAMATAVDRTPLANDLLSQAAAGAQDSFTADAARKLLALNLGIADGSLEAAIAAKIDALDLPTSGDIITLVPVSSRYLDLWQMWLEQVRKHVGGQVVAMAMDDAALANLHEVHTVDVRDYFAWDADGSLHPRTRGVLWYLRVLYLRELVRRGQTVLVLDLDAIPVSDLALMLENLPAGNVVAQKDHSIPMDVDRQLGFVLCCGFMLWRPSVATTTLLDRFTAETAIERDDQLALNHLLSRAGITNQREDARSMQFGSAGVHFVCPAPALVSRTLTSGSVVRHFHQQGKSIADLRAALGI